MYCIISLLKMKNENGTPFLWQNVKGSNIQCEKEGNCFVHKFDRRYSYISFTQTMLITFSLLMYSCAILKRQSYTWWRQPYIWWRQPYTWWRQPYIWWRQPYTWWRQPYTWWRQPYTWWRQPYTWWRQCRS